ncbi:Uncharacterized protein TCM_023426 [Theobroma cacao]|uniref:Uncharacterized protein n=1 Tax=Theobroma cacao TaxID=3641 RepID=A0A061EUX9_THECC|nr:Uncharacterized protein TCM_023426 [Theobroma cacao]
MAQTRNLKTIDANLWLLNSGASNHMTPNVKLFVEIDDQYCSKVEIGNDVYLQATRKGLVPIQTSSGARYEFEVLFVLEITKNLLSVGQMLKHNYVLLLKDMSCTIYAPNGDYMMNISMKQNCFPVNWKYACLQATKVHSNLTSLWHKRFGHCNYNSLIQLSNSGLVDKLPKLSECGPICQTCQLGKIAQKPYPTTSFSKSKDKLNLIHSDVGGPLSEESLNGSRHFVTFIDDLTRFCWIFFMKQKLETLSWFQKCKARAELKFGMKIKNRSWNWEQSQATDLNEFIDVSNYQHTDSQILVGDEIVDEALVRGVRSIQNIYERCHMAITELNSYEDTAVHEH